MMSYLYGGHILWVDLTHKTVKRLPTQHYASKYMGGRAINARLLYEMIDASTDPLGHNNVICFGAGPLSGTTFPGGSRTDIMCKSPVTNLIGNANMGGDFSPELKNAGWDHVVLMGKSSTPVYVFIRNDRVEIRDARAYWGMGNYATQAAIRADLGNPNYKIVSIGPAGENLVTYATVTCNIGNSGSRTGVGAVMGSKNCKAIVVRGTKGVPISHPEAFLDISLACHDLIRTSDSFNEVHVRGDLRGQTALLRTTTCAGDAHATAPSFDGKFDWERDAWLRWGYKRTGCTGCPIHCMECYNIPGIGASVFSCKLYNQLSAEVRNDDFMLWYKLTRECLNQGIDAVSVAVALQWVGLLWELGIVDESVTDGHDMAWGNSKALEGMFWDIVERRGFGDKLSQGLRAAASYVDEMVPEEKRNGRSVYYHALQVNNNPMPGLTASLHGQALAYAIGRRSDLIGDHDPEELYCAASLGSDMSEDYGLGVLAEKMMKRAEEVAGTREAGTLAGYRGKAALIHDYGMTFSASDIVGTCKWHTSFFFFPIVTAHYAEALSAGLGRAVTPTDIANASLRMRNVERALECKMGRRRENDTIPEKEFDRKLAHGSLKGKFGTSKEGLERMKSEYYLIRGWDQETGIPYEETLLEYGLDDIAQDLAEMGILPKRPETESSDAMKDPSLAWILLDEEQQRMGSAESTDNAIRRPGPSDGRLNE